MINIGEYCFVITVELETRDDEPVHMTYIDTIVIDKVTSRHDVVKSVIAKTMEYYKGQEGELKLYVESETVIFLSIEPN